MGKFFKSLFASCLGTILALVVLAFVGVQISLNAVKQAQKAEKIKPNTVLQITMSDPIPEKTNNIPVNPYDLSTENIIGLYDIIGAIGRAKEDDNIKGIYMEFSGVNAGLATSKALRDALVDFKESGKFIVAYSEYFSQKAYYLVSVADKIYVNPIGGVDFLGFSAQVPFFKDMLDKAGIEYQIFYAGKFKSATEPFRRTNMSDENRLQTREFLDDMYQNFLKDIADSRGITVAELSKIANEYAIREPADAVTYKLADEEAYKDQVLDDLRQRLGLESDAKINSTTLSKYNDANKKKLNFKTKEKIALVFAEGSIVDGKGEPGMTGSAEYTKMLRKIRNDDKIKAIVLRVNSPGGSAIASEQIWRELTLAKEAGKKIVVSMGDYAASGGYYIACMADTIIAEPNTLTGSIGVFGMYPVAEKMLKDKVGITFDTVKTGEYSVGLSPFITPSDKEFAIIQQSTDNFYNTFLTRVADGRQMDTAQVHEVAQGRVWTGSRALELGLVDKIGNLDDAIATAANLAGLDNYRLSEYPRTKEPIQQLIEQLTGKEMVNTKAIIKNELGDYADYYDYLKTLKEMEGIQARMPFVVEIK